jgi:hypothetical protein
LLCPGLAFSCSSGADCIPYLVKFWEGDP